MTDLKRKKKLTKLRITEVSSVDVGANEGARVMLMKRNNDDVDATIESPWWGSRFWHHGKGARRLAKLMAELGWTALRVRDLTRGG